MTVEVVGDGKIECLVEIDHPLGRPRRDRNRKHDKHDDREGEPQPRG